MSSAGTSTPRRWVIGSLLYFCAAAVGIASAYAVLRSNLLAQPIQVGAWATTTLAGNPNADLYTRAKIALDALLALSREETMYYVARSDSAGRPLRSQCSYEVKGQPPAARWWSITAYADDMFLFDAANKQFSLNGSTARLNAAGEFVLRTGSAEPVAGTGEAPRWLPTPGARGVVLTLRLYNPLPVLQAAPGSLPAPSITLVGACP